MFVSNNHQLQQFADDCCWGVCNDSASFAIDSFESLCKACLHETFDMGEVALLMREMNEAISQMFLTWDQGDRFAKVRWLADAVCPQAHLYA